ncbi:MAG: hypothetical protein COA50_11060 [Flavobacteriaceae bacterium]|nr:MAG: hypothetical protein COA50_11060 [Flavobacteriaceae bacterium]
MTALGLVIWGGYLIHAFSKFFKLKNTKRIFGESKFVYYGTELDYMNVVDLDIVISDSDMILNLHLAYSKEPIVIVSAFMPLKRFHEIVKIFIERKATSLVLYKS